MSQPAADSDTGFIDVAANALAVMILVTMIILTVAAVPAERGEVPADTAPALPFPPEIPPIDEPDADYFLVTAAGITPLPLSAVARQIAAGSAEIETDVGRFYFQNSRRRYRDLSEYRLDFTPDWTRVEAGATPIDATPEAETNRAQFVAERQAAFEAGRAPTFLVGEGGFTSFAGLYAQLRDTPVPLRWVPVRRGYPLQFSRDSENFETQRAVWR